MEAVTKPKYLLEDSGEIVLNQKDGKRIVLGHFDQEKKHLEYASKEASVKYRTQIMTAIGTEADGTTPSDRTARTMSIKGESRDDTKSIPQRPKMDKNLGDTTPELVEWYFKHKPKEAYVRYGVKLDKHGEPVRGHVRRKVTETTDLRELDDAKIPSVEDGSRSETKGPVVQQAFWEEKKDGIIASRMTHMTYLKEEQVGYDGSDDDEFEGMEESA